jgi:hypothetical protein
MEGEFPFDRVSPKALEWSGTHTEFAAFATQRIAPACSESAFLEYSNESAAVVKISGANARVHAGNTVSWTVRLGCNASPGRRKMPESGANEPELS